MDNRLTDREYACSCMQEAIAAFPFKGKMKQVDAYGNGHINDTFLLVFEHETKITRYILQRINHIVFTNPEQVMENILGVTSFLREKMKKAGYDSDRKTLQVMLTKYGKPYYKDKIGCYWRVYNFISHAVSYSLVEKEEDFYESAVAFGTFQKLLSDFPVEQLHNTIPNFHNTQQRYENCMKVISEDINGRVKEVKQEIMFVREHEGEMNTLVKLLENGEIPMRVTHNDTKLNNVMLDADTGKGICIIDLDTVMPGSALYDFGDSIRFGASTAKEDEKDLSIVQCSMKLFEIYTKGFLYGTGDSLTPKEVELLPMGAKLMTLECGMRFLTDYLQGDIYFKTAYASHNLDRCRTQFKLVQDMESKWDTMQNIVKKYQSEK